MAGRQTDTAGVEPVAAVSLNDITLRLDELHLQLLGGFAATGDEPGLPKGCRTLLLLGPRQPGFWPHLQSQPEWQDGAADPIDRWSRRVIGRLACDLGGKALFPFGGPPWQPFYSWAIRTGAIWESPVKLLVHAEQGLFVSFRGALALKEMLALPPVVARPCDTCLEKPCLTACPAGALTGRGYDVPACHTYLNLPEGATCMEGGCHVRTTCPVSHRHARMAEQSAYHMRQFHK